MSVDRCGVAHFAICSHRQCPWLSGSESNVGLYLRLFRASDVGVIDRLRRVQSKESRVADALRMTDPMEWGSARAVGACARAMLMV